MKILVFVPRTLKTSRADERLRALASGYPYIDVVWHYENVNSDQSLRKADLRHMRNRTIKRLPDVVIALGAKAHYGALTACFDQPLVIMAPHPASLPELTTNLYWTIGNELGMLNTGFVVIPGCRLIRYSQERNRIVVFPDPWFIHESLVEAKHA